MHEHPALVTVFLTGGKARFTLPDGKTREGENRAGQVAWSDPETHAGQNVSDKAVEVLQIEFKRKPAGAAASEAPDPVTVDAKHYKTEFENDSVHVLRISYGPHEKSVMHNHPDGVAVFLTDHQVKFTYPDGKTEERSAKAGQVLWNRSGQHLPENTTDKPWELVLIELKRS